MQTAPRAALLAVTFTGCFSPSYPEGLACGTGTPTCPPGQSCAADLKCHSSSISIDAAAGDSPAALDATIDAMLDNPWTDESVADGDLFGVWGVSTSETFAVGGTAPQGTLLRRFSGSWLSDMTPIGTGRLEAISGVGTAWATGIAGDLYAYSGGAWSKATPSLGGQTMHGISVPGAAVGMAVGDNGSAYAYDGGWKVGPATGSSAALTAVWGSSTGMFYAVGPNDLLLKTTLGATAWTPLLMPPMMATNNLKSVFSNSDAIFVGSDSLLLAYVNASTVVPFQFGCSGLDGQSGVVWCASNGGVYRGTFAGGFKKDLDAPGVTFTAIHVVGTDVFAVGLGGAIWHRKRLD